MTYPTDEMVEAACAEIFYDEEGKASIWDDIVAFNPVKATFLRERCRAALIAAEQAAWRPIEEAPRDGTQIIVHGGSVEWHSDCGAGEWFSHSAQRFLQWNPTHFRPMPPLPKGGV